VVRGVETGELTASHMMLVEKELWGESGRLRIVLCGLMKFNQQFRGRCCLLALLTSCCQANFLLGSVLNPEDGGDMFL
jgi:hypothetical protein